MCYAGSNTGLTDGGFKGQTSNMWIKKKKKIPAENQYMKSEHANYCQIITDPTVKSPAVIIFKSDIHCMINWIKKINKLSMRSY